MSSTAEAVASATSAAISASASSSSSDAQPASYKVIGILLAVGSGLLIGASFIFKKRGLLAAQKKSGGVAGEGHPYLKSWLVRPRPPFSLELHASQRLTPSFSCARSGGPA